MKFKNKALVYAYILIIATIICGCGKSQFDEDYKVFKESYIQSTNFLENKTDSLYALRDMKVNEVEKELKRMKELIEKMSNESASKSQEGLLENVKEYYQEVEFLLYASKNYNNLTTEEKEKVYLEADMINLNRNSIKRGDE